MSEQTVFFIFAAIAAALVPLVPKIVVFRIKVLRFLHLAGFADWHQRNFAVVVIALRVILTMLAITLVILGIFGR